MTCLTAVIGDPVHHSLSPAIANAAFKALGLDWRMLALKVPEGESARVLEIMRSLEMGGISVTMPHKKDIVQHLDALDESATTLAAVNCVVPEDGKLIGYNTDGIGFLTSLKNEGVNLSGARVLLFGAGGAGLAVASACVQAGAEKVAISARSKAEELAKKLGLPVEVFSGRYSDFDILVNATPLGMDTSAISSEKNESGKNLMDETPIQKEAIQKNHVIVDLVYNPTETKLLKQAKEQGAKTIGGLGMLIGQATEAIHLWTGKTPDTKILVTAADEHSIVI